MIGSLATLLLALALTAQAQHPEFSVATVRPSAPDSTTLTQIQGRRFVTKGTTFLDLFKYAYSVHESQVIGGPDWLRTEKFDVVADPESEPRPSSDDMKALVRQFLFQRFKAALQSDTRELPVFALQQTGAAPKLTLSAAHQGDMPAVGGGLRGTLAMRNGTMQDFAAYLQRFAGAVIDRPVVDQTALHGRYDLELHFLPDASSTSDPNVPGIFTAIQEQLGLKLKPTRAPVNVYVITAASRPSLDS